MTLHDDNECTTMNKKPGLAAILQDEEASSSRLPIHCSAFIVIMQCHAVLQKPYLKNINEKSNKLVNRFKFSNSFLIYFIVF